MLLIAEVSISHCDCLEYEYKVVFQKIGGVGILVLDHGLAWGLSVDVLHALAGVGLIRWDGAYVAGCY